MLIIYYYCNLGGVCSVIKQRMPGLLQEGWEIDCLFTTDNGGEDSLRESGASKVVFTSLNDLERCVKEMCDERKYRVFTVFDMPAAYKAVKKVDERYKVVFEIHTPIAKVIKDTPIKLLQDSDAVAVPSKWSVKEIKSLVPGAEQVNITVVPNIVDHSLFYKGKASHINHRSLIWMGKYAAYKNPTEALAISVRLAAIYDSLHVYFVTGGQADHKFFKKICSAFLEIDALDRFHWLHNLPHDEIGGFYRDAAMDEAVFLHTSTNESFCLAVHEAVRCGLPVVASKAGPLDEIILHGQNGYLYDSGDIESAVTYVSELLDNADIYTKVTNAHSRVLHNFDNAIFIKSYIELLRKTTGWVSPVESRSFQSLDRSRPRVAALLDEFSRECFDPEMELLDITTENWREVLADEELDFLFIESAWVGFEDSWVRKVAYEDGRGEIYELIKAAKRKKLKVVFWNKEDPMHYDLFLGLAKRCDYIFTTDENCVKKYQADVCHERVFVLPFAAQPLLHNPINKCELENCDLLFAGSWYERFPQRNQFLEKTKAALMRPGFHIYDRHFWNSNLEMRFPEHWQPYIYPAISFKCLLNAVKNYKVVLNVNTVTDSPSMCARRPFEISAASTPLISNSSRALDEMLPGLVFQVDDNDSMEAVLNKLLGDKQKRLLAGHRAWRYVMEHHTYAHRTEKMCSELGLLYKSKSLEWPSVSVCIYNGMSIVDQNYEGRCEQIIVDLESLDTQKIVDKCTGEIILFCDGRLSFTADVLKDVVLAFRYAQADIVGKVTPDNNTPNTKLAWRFLSNGNLPVFGGKREALSEISLKVNAKGLIVEAVDPQWTVYSCDPFYLN